jgi:pimeloyl-ACP methyl ester carboxylesterase
MKRIPRLANRILLLAVCAAVIYFLAPILLLRFALDRLIFPKVDSGATHEDRLINVSLETGRSILIRQYGGSELPHCAVFFPGQHGGIATYERTLFPNIEQLGIAVYALSYPGQDGAPGRSYRAALSQDVARAITAISLETSCQPINAVFIGRSLGSAVAIDAATRFRPKGLLLDGVAPTLTIAIQAAVQRRVVTRPWGGLPFRLVMGNDFSLLPAVASLAPTPIVIFQGTNDRVTPFIDAQEAFLKQNNVQFIAVPDATHDNAYLRSQPQYSKKLAELASR